MLVVDPDFKVNVRPGGTACASNLGNQLALTHLLAFGNKKLAAMSINGLESFAMVDNYQVAVSVLIPGKNYHAAIARDYRASGGAGKIQAGMKLIFPHEEAVAITRGKSPVIRTYESSNCHLFFCSFYDDLVDRGGDYIPA